jgi:uncharacterized protein YcfL
MKKLLVCFIVVLLTGCASQGMNRKSSNISFRVPLFDNSRLYTNLSTYKNSNGDYQVKGSSSINFGKYGRNINARLNW